MRNILLGGVFAFLSISSIGGNGSGAGGGPVVFQAALLQQILADKSFILGFDMHEKALITSIERLHADKGISTYRVTSNGGCDIKIVTDCASAMGARDCTITYGAWLCP